MSCCKQQRGLVRFRSRTAEEHLGVVDGSETGDLFSEGNCRFDQIQRRGVQDTVRLGLDCDHDLGNAVAGDCCNDSSEEVEVGGPVRIPHSPALATLKGDRVLVVKGKPRGHHRTMSCFQCALVHGYSSGRSTPGIHLTLMSTRRCVPGAPIKLAPRSLSIPEATQCCLSSVPIRLPITSMFKQPTLFSAGPPFLQTLMGADGESRNGPGKPRAVSFIK